MRCSWIGEAGRCDVVVAGVLGISRNRARRWIAGGLVRVGDRPAEKGQRIRRRDVLEVDLDGAVLTPDPGVRPVIVQRTPDYLVIDKPAGTPVLPPGLGGAGDRPGSILEGLAAHEPGAWATLADGDHAAVHRLDTPTSGLVLFARSPRACAGARGRWQEAVKEYEALVPMAFDRFGPASMHLRVQRHRPARVGRAEAGDPAARLCRMTIGDGGAACAGDRPARRIRVRLETGFLHQIRAMCAAWGVPVLGDTTYGGDAAARLMLHARRLELPSLGIDAVSGTPF